MKRVIASPTLVNHPSVRARVAVRFHTQFPVHESNQSGWGRIRQSALRIGAVIEARRHDLLARRPVTIV